MNEIYKFNGKNFDKITWNGGYITSNFEWHSWINNSDKISNLWGVQGVHSSATYIRWRTLVIEGIISAESYSDLLNFAKEIKKLFAVDWVPVQEATKLLEITDNNGLEWQAQARVKTLPQFKLWSTDGEYRAVLFLSDALYRSNIINISTWDEGIMAGHTHPTTHPVAHNQIARWIILATNTWINTPLKITLIITWDIEEFLTIHNVTNGEYYTTNTQCTAWDIIIIDADARTATKNWISILWDKQNGSSWLTILEDSEIVIADGDLAWDFTASIEWQDLLL